ncbi:hypothetical protein ANN_18016 [Periplaneta americana]|uniref:Uncharacterized protein n=1 Tax=Periplaneta americana TaxID=6978 RepID=A0ABQ8SMJ7_PERAM|nr:hypothetical protein ANN_18016 [Periplaneta americana]
MAGLCEGGNEPPGSLKASKRVFGKPPRIQYPRAATGGNYKVCTRKQIFLEEKLALKVDPTSRKNDAETDQKEKRELAGSLTEKKLLTEGCTGRNGEREKSSGQKKTSDDRRH